MMLDLDGYEEADLIDTSIDSLLKTHGINKDNAKQWLLFARTIKTSCDLIIELASKQQMEAQLETR